MIIIFGTAVEFVVVPFFPHPTEIALFFFNLFRIDPQPWHILITLPVSFVFLIALLVVARVLGRFHAKLAKFFFLCSSDTAKAHVLMGEIYQTII
jgi:hypothetical protein